MISSLVAYYREPRAILDDRCHVNTAVRSGLKISGGDIPKLSEHGRIALCLLEYSATHGVVVPHNMVKGITPKETRERKPSWYNDSHGFYKPAYSEVSTSSSGPRGSAV